MRVMIIRKADKETEAGVMPSTELLGAMGAYMDEMHRAGVLLAGDGLKPSRDGIKVKFSNGKPTFTDGPFTEAKEIVAGYAIINVKSLDEAKDWVRRWPALDSDGEVELEIRPFFEADDFGEQFTPEQRAAEDRIRAEMAKNT